jgi:hypothetical protein
MALKKRKLRKLKKWREKGESFRVDRYRCIEGRCLHQVMSAKIKVTKTKTALKQETHNLSDLKPDPHCGFVELGGSVSDSRSHHKGMERYTSPFRCIVTNTIDSKTF